MKAKTRDKRQDTLLGGTGLGGRHCVEPRISLLSFLFSFSLFYLFGINEWRFCFFSISTLSSFFLLGSFTSSSGKYIHISRGLDRIFISISISHAATVLLLVTSFSSSSSSSSSNTTYHYHLANISTWFRVPVSESVLKK